MQRVASARTTNGQFCGFATDSGCSRVWEAEKAWALLESPEQFDHLVRLRHHEALSRLSRIDLVGGGHPGFGDHVPVVAQGFDVPLYDGFVPHVFVNVREKYY